MNFEQARREVVAACRELADKGYLAGTGGNVACRADDGHFMVTPTATDYYAMRPEDICVLRLDNLARVAGDRRPSIERKLHAHVLRVRQDCRASIHTHQPIASAYTLLGRALDIHDPLHRIMLGKKAAFVGYAPSGTGWLASKLREGAAAGDQCLPDAQPRSGLLRSHAGRDGGQDRSPGVGLRQLLSRCNRPPRSLGLQADLCPKFSRCLSIPEIWSLSNEHLRHHLDLTRH